MATEIDRGKLVVSGAVLVGLVALLLFLAAVAVIQEVELTGLLKQSPQNTTTTCVVIPERGAYRLLVSDVTQDPLSNVAVISTPVSSTGCSVEVMPNETYITNSTGWVALGWGPSDIVFGLSVVYGGSIYNISVPIGAEDLTYATLSLPSGYLNIKMCYTFGGIPCHAYNQTVSGSQGGTAP